MQDVDARVRELMSRMSLEEKVGQLQQVPAAGGHIPESLRDAVRAGRVGSVLNEVDLKTVDTLQWIAMHESRMRIPLLVGRDVIHGFKTVFPIPLAQACSWNPDIVQRAARVSALEAAASGINWTFAPMIDIGRDPRWGRVAEGFGEDPYLTGIMAAAAVRGFQGDDLAHPGSIAACAKHFAGYGASEGGRDYNTTNIPEHELRNVHLPPFRDAINAGAASIMTSFSDLNGIPATGNAWLLQTVLREEWKFDGVVVSDWESIKQLAVHGLTEGDRDSAVEAILAGVDMEMASTTYADHLVSLVHEGRIAESTVDRLTANILRLKFRLGLFDNPYTDASQYPAPGCADHLALAAEAARESLVLLKNAWHQLAPVLPLQSNALQDVAIIGPLADDPYEQLGTWIFDGDASLSVTVVQAMRAQLGDRVTLHIARGVETTRSHDRAGFDDAVAAARRSQVAVMILGEEAILSGEAHCRSDITLPGAQAALIEAVASTGTPIVLVVMAGRALALESVLAHVHALIYAWHPGSLSGTAIADVLLGNCCPSGKLAVTLPRVTGQIPIYYAHKHTGKPPTPETVVHMDDIEARAPQLSIGNTSFHLDVAHTPLFPFGFGLSYTSFEYRNIATSHATFTQTDELTVSADVVNTGAHGAYEVVQLYIRDIAASVTRPVRELKAFERIFIEPGERRTVSFTLRADDLAFYGRQMTRVTEPGVFHVWIGGSSTTDLRTEVVLTP